MEVLTSVKICLSCLIGGLYYSCAGSGRCIFDAGDMPDSSSLVLVGIVGFLVFRLFPMRSNIAKLRFLGFGFGYLILLVPVRGHRMWEKLVLCLFASDFHWLVYLELEPHLSLFFLCLD